MSFVLHLMTRVAFFIPLRMAGGIHVCFSDRGLIPQTPTADSYRGPIRIPVASPGRAGLQGVPSGEGLGGGPGSVRLASALLCHRRPELWKVLHFERRLNGPEWMAWMVRIVESVILNPQGKLPPLPLAHCPDIDVHVRVRQPSPVEDNDTQSQGSSARKQGSPHLQSSVS